MSRRPPRLPRTLLRLALPRDERDTVLRDLDDEFEQHVRPVRGPFARHAWYWRQALGSIRPAMAMRRRRNASVLDRTAGDLRFAWKSLRRRRVLACSAIATLALGIGSTTAIFSIVDAVVLRPLPYSAPDRLIRIWSANPRGIPRNSISPPDFFDFQHQAIEGRAVASMAAFTAGDSVTLQGDIASRVVVSMVSPDLFSTLGVLPAAGRPFVAADAADGAAPVAIVSRSLARARGDAAIGHSLIVGDVATTVVGIMPDGFAFPSATIDIWVPLPASLRQRSRSAHYLDAIGRLAEDATVESATGLLRTIAARLEQAHPATNRGWGVTVASLHDSVTGNVRRPLLVLLAAVGGLLLIACANVAGLLIADAQQRVRELSLRAALGASPSRLVAQQLVESLLLACAGAIGGLFLARLGVALLQQAGTLSLPRGESIAVDLRALVVTTAVAVLAGVAAGLAPAVRAARADPEGALKTARDAGVTVAGARFRAVLVAAQIAVALALTVSAGLLIRSFARLTAVDTGFDRRDVVLAQVTLAGSRFEPERWSAYVERALPALRSLPGVAAAGAASPLPLSGQQGLLRFGVRFPGRPAPSDGRSDRSYLRWATPGYFDAIGIPLVAGRPFDRRDTRDAPRVAVVDRTFVDRYFPGEDAVGRELQMSNEKTPRRIVGVVGGVRPVSLDQQAEPHVYVPQSQNASPVMTFVVRGEGDLRTLQQAVRARLLEEDPGKPVYNVRTAAEMIDATLAQRRMNTWLLALFASAAGILSAIGMYGLMAEWVSASRREIGVRLALGARRGEVLRVVLRRVVVVSLAGVVAGVPLAYAGTGVVRSLLFEVAPRDAVTLAFACLLVLAVGIAGALVPARKAIDVNPVDALRLE